MLLLVPLIVQGAMGAPVTPPSADYRIGPGDKLHVEVYGEDFGGSFQVASNGEISFPFCDMVPLGELTVFEAEQKLRDCLADGYLNDPQLSVRVEEYRSQRVEVLADRVGMLVAGLGEFDHGGRVRELPQLLQDKRPGNRQVRQGVAARRCWSWPQRRITIGSYTHLTQPLFSRFKSSYFRSIRPSFVADRYDASSGLCRINSLV